MTHCRGILLDVDGTLVDSNDAHAHAWVAAFADHDVDVPFTRVRRCIGMGGDKVLRSVAGIEAETSLGKAISAARQSIFSTKYLPHLKPFAQVDELLERMHDSGYQLAVASSAKKQELESLLAICGADRFVKHTTSSDDAENSKPDPDIVQAALQKIDLPAEEVLLLGDTPYDVEASGQAGVGAVALRCGGWADFDLDEALAIFDSPADLLAHFDRSPFIRELP